MAQINYWDGTKWASIATAGAVGPAGPKGDKGDDGAPGVDGKDGRGLNPTGDWQADATYSLNDVVQYNGSSYVLVDVPPAGTKPDDAGAGAYWNLLASKGADGPSEPSRDDGNSITKGSDGLLYLNLTEWRVLADGSLVKIDPDALVLVFDTSLGADSDEIGFRLSSSRNLVNVQIDWGDGQSQQVTGEGAVTHTYAETGRYVVSIKGNLDHFGSSPTGGGHPAGFAKLYQVVSWGTTGLSSLEAALQGAKYMDAPVARIPPSVLSTARMFQGCEAFNQPITNLDTSSVRDMTAMFDGCAAFNQPVSHLRTSKVEAFGSMFRGCANFNQPVAGLDMSYAESALSMFSGCADFNQPVSIPVAPRLRTVGSMFAGCRSLNQPVAIDGQSIETMSAMFADCVLFNQPVTFATPKCTNFAGMFQRCAAFNQPVTLDTSAATNLSGMFEGCSAFNRALTFNTANVTTMASMFSGCTVFNRALTFNTSKVTSMSSMFNTAPAFNSSIASFDTSSVVNMSFMFFGARAFNQAVNFNTANVTNMTFMFADAVAFNQPVSSFNTAKVTNMASMFARATVFNRPITNFVTSSVTSMASMFEVASAFNQPLDFLRFTSLGAGGLVNFLSQAVAFTTANYDALLAAWRNQLNEVGSTMRRDHRPTVAAKYSATAAATRTELQTAGWVITDGGQV